MVCCSSVCWPPAVGLYATVSTSQSHIATDGQSVSMSWCRAQIWDFWPEILFCLFIFFLSYCLVIFGGRPLWREVGSVMCIVSTLLSRCVLLQWAEPARTRNSVVPMENVSRATGSATMRRTALMAATRFQRYAVSSVLFTICCTRVAPADCITDAVVKVKVTLRLTVSQSVSQYVLVSSQIWDFWPELFFFKVTVLSFLGRPLWREVGSVMCQSLSLKSTRVSHYLQLFKF
jgi:hypothetical protein